MLYHMVMDNLLDKLVENNSLSEMPEKAPTTWGFWVGKANLNSLKHQQAHEILPCSNRHPTMFGFKYALKKHVCFEICLKSIRVESLVPSQT
jgi:hypothetical protein